MKLEIVIQQTGLPDCMGNKCCSTSEWGQESAVVGGGAVLGQFELESKNTFRGFHPGINRCYVSSPRCIDQPSPQQVGVVGM